MKKLKPIPKFKKGEPTLSRKLGKANNGVTEKLLEKYLRRKVVIDIERSSKTIKQTKAS